MLNENYTYAQMERVRALLDKAKETQRDQRFVAKQTRSRVLDAAEATDGQGRREITKAVQAAYKPEVDATIATIRAEHRCQTRQGIEDMRAETRVRIAGYKREQSESLKLKITSTRANYASAVKVNTSQILKASRAPKPAKVPVKAEGTPITERGVLHGVSL